MYQSSNSHQATPLALSLISDTVLNPTFLPAELDSQRDAARYEARELKSKPEVILPEILHSVAYGQRTLGNPMLCPDDRINVIDEALLRSCMTKWYRPERMVIAGAGMQHADLVEWVDKYFSSLKSKPDASLEVKASYTGGHHFILDQDSELDHIYVGFEGVGIHDDDIYTLATMQVLLGGGGSFSAGNCSRS
jgi:processing peptidase subunit alpha